MFCNMHYWSFVTPVLFSAALKGRAYVRLRSFAFSVGSRGIAGFHGLQFQFSKDLLTGRMMFADRLPFVICKHAGK